MVKKLTEEILQKKIQILGIPGSIRKESYNNAILHNAVSLAPKDAKLTIFERLADIPPFDQDSESNPPAVVKELKKQIMASDAILFATPEYNYSIPGVLKNLIDWASRPYGQSAWEDKPVGIMSASGGMLGGARAQYQLRQVFIFLNMHPLNRPEVIIPQVQDKVNAKGQLTDDHTKEKVAELLQALVKWTVELKAGKEIVSELEDEEYGSAYHRMTA